MYNKVFFFGICDQLAHKKIHSTLALAVFTGFDFFSPMQIRRVFPMGRETVLLQSQLLLERLLLVVALYPHPQKGDGDQSNDLENA